MNMKKKNVIGRKLVTKPWNTSAFYHAPLKGPIGCKLVISYAKLLKLANLISSFTDMKLTKNHQYNRKNRTEILGLISQEDE